jgi:hypothetical protein
MGRTPFVDFSPKSGLAWLAALLVTLAAVSLAGRELWKRSLPEGTEVLGKRFLSDLWLYLSVLAYMYAFIVWFMGRYMYPRAASNPWGVVLGGALFGAGLSLILVFRPFALRNELRGTINIMVGMLAALSREARWKMMVRRIRTIAAYPPVQCSWHVGAMFSAVEALPPGERAEVEATRNEVMMSLSSGERRALMVAMDLLHAA